MSLGFKSVKCSFFILRSYDVNYLSKEVRTPVICHENKEDIPMVPLSKERTTYPNKNLTNRFAHSVLLFLELPFANGIRSSKLNMNSNSLNQRPPGKEIIENPKSQTSIVSIVFQNPVAQDPPHNAVVTAGVPQWLSRSIGLAPNKPRGSYRYYNPKGAKDLILRYSGFGMVVM